MDDIWVKFTESFYAKLVLNVDNNGEVLEVGSPQQQIDIIILRSHHIR